jgi:Ni,Fe-hydrogenase III small subunit
MFSALRVKRSQGKQYVADVRGARPPGLVGLPVIAAGPCAESCQACVDACPTGAVALEPLRIDLGRCVFCSECVEVCPDRKIAFTNDPRLAATKTEQLVVRAGDAAGPAVAPEDALRKLFGRSLKLRQVSAGGCNGCELELNAMANVNFDFGRWGIDWVASPRHADALVLSGPITANMAEALERVYAGMPAPKFVVAFGACAVSGGLYAESPALDRSFFARFAPSLYVPGCPPHPLTFIHALLDLLGVGTPKPARLRDVDPRIVAAKTDAANQLINAVGCDVGVGPRGAED